jgi:hypothetical protein
MNTGTNSVLPTQMGSNWSAKNKHGAAKLQLLVSRATFLYSEREMHFPPSNPIKLAFSISLSTKLAQLIKTQ